MFYRYKQCILYLLKISYRPPRLKNIIIAAAAIAFFLEKMVKIHRQVIPLKSQLMVTHYKLKTLSLYYYLLSSLYLFKNM